MPEIIEVELSDGEVILAEVTVAGGDVGVLDHLKLSGAKSVIRSVGRWAKESIHDGLPGAPRRFGIEFGVKLAVKSGELASILAEVAGEATMTIKMEWENDPSKDNNENEVSDIDNPIVIDESET
jgi:hypothetical protein